jgi:hypothetical protein
VHMLPSPKKMANLKRRLALDAILVGDCKVVLTNLGSTLLDTGLKLGTVPAHSLDFRGPYRGEF